MSQKIEVDTREIAVWVTDARSAERKRIIGLIKPHLEVCNYKAVNEEDCDVCYWVETTIEQINSGKENL